MPEELPSTTPAIPPTRTILVLGPGPGEAARYESMIRATVRAYKQKGETVILASPDAFSDAGADRLYQVPLTPGFLERVIAQERPRAIVISAAGQEALKAGLILDSQNILRRYSVETIGTPIPLIRDLIERPIGVLELPESDVPVRKSIACRNLEEGLRAAEFVGYPVTVRGVGEAQPATDSQKLKEHVRHALLSAETVLIEEDVGGHSAIIVIVLTDKAGTSRAVADLEHLDPLSSVEQDPILISPAQTLAPELRDRLHSSAAALASHLGVIGVSTITFALDRKNSQERLISLEPGISRTSALAACMNDSNLGECQTLLTLGETLETVYVPTGEIHAVAVALPATERRRPEHTLTPTFAGEVLSGEVLAFGQTFSEALQSGLRMLRIGYDGYNAPTFSLPDLRQELRLPGAKRLIAVADTFAQDWGLNQVHAATGIDLVWLQAIERSVRLRGELLKQAGNPLAPDLLWQLKQDGFSDEAIGRIRNQSAADIAALRQVAGVQPKLRAIRDNSNRHFLSYLGDSPSTSVWKNTPGLLFALLGPTVSPEGRSGNWCTAEAIQECHRDGPESVIVTADPWSGIEDTPIIVAELSNEHVAEITRLVRPAATCVWSAGETAPGLSHSLALALQPALGTSHERTAACDDPRRLASLYTEIGAPSPDWREVADADSALATAELISYPVLLRASHGLTGSRTIIAKTPDALRTWFAGRDGVGREAHVVLAPAGRGDDLEVEAVAQDGVLLSFAINENIERLGSEDGAGTTVIPAQRTSLHTLRQVKALTSRLAAALEISGPLTLQFLCTERDSFVIGCSPQFGRHAPLTQLATGTNLAQLALAAGRHQSPITQATLADGDDVAIRVSQRRLVGGSVRRESTTNVADTAAQALLLGFLGLGFSPPERRVLLCIDDLEDLTRLLPTIQSLQQQGAVLLATTNAHEFLLSRSIPTGLIHRLNEPRSPNVREYVEQRRLDVVVSIPPLDHVQLLEESRAIQDLAARYDITFLGSVDLLAKLTEALGTEEQDSLPCRPCRRFSAK